jgi:hypothetical protein
MELVNTLDYYDTATITAIIGFIVQAPAGANVIKLLMAVTYKFS